MVFKSLSTIDKPFELRDPFKPPFERKKIDFSSKPKNEGAISPEEFMKTINIEDIKVVGVLVGKDRRAVVKLKGNDGTFLVKEGMLVGPDKAELKAILPGGIVLVEKIKNVYDDDEYIETVIPLSTN
jgi:type IV pilus assembly protein PilP